MVFSNARLTFLYLGTYQRPETQKKWRHNVAMLARGWRSYQGMAGATTQLKDSPIIGERYVLRIEGALKSLLSECPPISPYFDIFPCSNGLSLFAHLVASSCKLFTSTFLSLIVAPAD